MRALVTGAAGYIGSFMVRSLLGKGDNVIAFDNLERGHKEVIDPRAKFIEGDIKNRKSLEALFKNESIDALIHFAAYISVEESEKSPKIYYQNNVVGSKNLFESAIDIGNVRNIIFSSSAAVYGNPQKVPIPEDHPKNPTSEYGKNKLAMEEILESIRKDNPDVSFAALRYFNAAGAAMDGSNGENHDPETHIIPLAIHAATEDSKFKLYGTDYNTPDGTCIRDYIHVLDLVEAHILALEKIQKDSGSHFYNVGTGNGYSNRQVLEMVKKVSGKTIKVREEARRAGDPERLVADPTRIKTELGFEPKYSDLETIVKTAWAWHSRKERLDTRY